MRIIEYDGRTVWVFTQRAFNNTAKWILNKCFGKVVREKNWDCRRKADYEWIEKALNDDRYSYYMLDKSIPPKGRIITSKFSFRVYEIEVIDPKYFFHEKILVFVPKKRRPNMVDIKREE